MPLRRFLLLTNSWSINQTNIEVIVTKNAYNSMLIAEEYCTANIIIRLRIIETPIYLFRAWNRLFAVIRLWGAASSIVIKVLIAANRNIVVAVCFESVGKLNKVVLNWPSIIISVAVNIAENKLNE